MIGEGLSGPALLVCYVSALLAAQQKPVVGLHVVGGMVRADGELGKARELLITLSLRSLQNVVPRARMNMSSR